MTGRLLQLLRWRLTLMNGFAAIGGYLLYPAEADATQLLAVFGGTALLAAAGSAANQALEHDIDRLMERTRRRPVAQGSLTPEMALATGALLAVAGLLWLGVLGSPGAALLGVAALLWYLAVYTPLKRRTSLALPIGALCGAVPPLIGWSIAGGLPGDHRIMLLAGVMYLWQIPHFWLLQRRHSSDYRSAGIPLCPIDSGSKRTPLFTLWIIALVAAAMLLPVFGIIAPQRAVWYAVVLMSMILMLVLRSDKLLFTSLNLFPLLILLAVWP